MDEKEMKNIDLATAINVDKSNITNWLNKDNTILPQNDRLQKLANYFDVSLDYIFNFTSIKNFMKI